MENKTRTNKKLISLSDRNLDMMDALMEETGWNTPTQIVRRGIEELYKQTFKYGKDPANTTKDGDSMEDIQRKAQRKALEKKALKEAEEQAKLQPKIDICLNLLGGEIETNENGYKFCRFTSYHTNPKKDGSQLLPLRQVDTFLVDTMLFNPSQEAVFKARPEIRSKFNK